MEVAQRIIDFTCGATYSMDGNLQKISNYIFIATPSSVELSGDFPELLADGSMNVSGMNRLVRGLINLIFKSNIKDIMTGARAFNYEFVKSFPILSTGFEIETEMSIHALDKNFKLVEIPVGYRDRPEGSVSKLNTFSDGFKVLRTIARLFRDYKPFAFFGWLGLICFAIATAFFAPVLSGYLATGMVPKFPTLIACSGLYVISFLLWISGVILEVITKKHRQLFELYLNQLSILKRRDG